MVRHPKMRSLRSKAWPTSCLIISWQQFGEVNWVPWKTRVNGFAWPVHLWFLKASTANNPLALRKRGCTSRICQRKMRERFLCQGENGEDMSQCHNDGWNMNLDLAKKQVLLEKSYFVWWLSEPWLQLNRNEPTPPLGDFPLPGSMTKRDLNPGDVCESCWSINPCLGFLSFLAPTAISPCWLVYVHVI